MSDQLDKKSILEMSMGAILERVDYEMGKVMDNILDPNTKATAKRKISVTLELIPSADRRTITVQSTAKCSLTPTDPVTTSLYITNAPGPGVDYLLDLLSRMSKDSGVTTRDNGVSQEVEARQGVSLKALVQVKPRVALRPFRTFLEVEQPESEFLLRLDDDGNVGLFEADGGMWQQTAKASITAYFEDKLAEEVKDGKIVVMM